jgi:hypothetical protein
MKMKCYRINYEDESNYQGDILEGSNPPQRHGNGIFCSKDGDVLEGQWRKDRFHGYVIQCVQPYHVLFLCPIVLLKLTFLEYVYRFGTRIFSHSGDRHEGIYHKDKRHGTGTYVWKNGDKYIGGFYNGRVC